MLVPPLRVCAEESEFMSRSAQAEDLVIPGELITAEGNAGFGVTESGEGLVATRVGRVEVSDGVVSIAPSTDGPRLPEKGDVVIAQVQKLQTKTAEVKILHVQGKPIRDMPAEQLLADIFVAEIVDRFLPAPGDALRLRDVIRAEVLQTKPMLKLTTKPKANYGVLHANCPVCGEMLQPNSDVPDFNVSCPRCDYSGFRRLSDDYGSTTNSDGVAYSELNRGGERWSSAAESRLSHDGSRPYLSVMADFRRGHEHDTPKRFLGGSSGGGRDRRPRREMHKTVCTLCSDDCEVPFEPTPGKPIRCRPCMTKVEDGEATAEELAAEREVLLTAKREARETMGFKMFVGGLPYEATEEELSALFTPHGELKEVHIATDRESGKSRGFAFVTYASYTAGKKALGQLKGLKLAGRRITVQEAKSDGGGGRGGGGRGGRGDDRRSERR